MRFVKVEGAGNDYVLVDAFDQTVADPGGLAKAVSDRHLGVGSDGLLLVEPAAPPAHVRMRIFNADGSEGLMCGNGLRCVVRYAIEAGRATPPEVRVETRAGLRAGVLSEDGVVRTAMGRPSFDRETIGVDAAGDPPSVRLPAGLHGESAVCVSVGNPHAVVRVPDVDRADLAAYGRALQDSRLFRDGVNVHLVSEGVDGAWRVRPWERGSGATRACGTGAVAVAALARKLGWSSREEVAIDMPGGRLHVHWSGEEAVLGGPARLVFTGRWGSP